MNKEGERLKSKEIDDDVHSLKPEILYVIYGYMCEEQEEYDWPAIRIA